MCCAKEQSLVEWDVLVVTLGWMGCADSHPSPNPSPKCGASPKCFPEGVEGRREGYEVVEELRPEMLMRG